LERRQGQNKAGERLPGTKEILITPLPLQASLSTRYHIIVIDEAPQSELQSHIPTMTDTLGACCNILRGSFQFLAISCDPRTKSGARGGGTRDPLLGAQDFFRFTPHRGRCEKSLSFSSRVRGYYNTTLTGNPSLRCERSRLDDR
jgi:hypothetical protein